MNLAEGYRAQNKETNLILPTYNNVENYNSDKMQGIVTVIGHGFDHNGNFLDGQVLHKKNLILNSAREIMRDSMLGGDAPLYKIIFGDLGRDSNSSTAELVNVPSPVETDTQLVRKIGEKVLDRSRIQKIGIGAVLSPTESVSAGRPGIRYEVLLEKSDLVEDGNNKFILEMGLATKNDVLFSRITCPVIIKTPTLQLTLIWEILF